MKITTTHTNKDSPQSHEREADSCTTWQFYTAYCLQCCTNCWGSLDRRPEFWGAADWLIGMAPGLCSATDAPQTECLGWGVAQRAGLVHQESWHQLTLDKTTFIIKNISRRLKVMVKKAYRCKWCLVERYLILQYLNYVDCFFVNLDNVKMFKI